MKNLNDDTNNLIIPARHPVIMRLLDGDWKVFCNLKFSRASTHISFSAKPPDGGKLRNGRDKWSNVEAALRELARDAGLTGLKQSDPSSLRSAPEILE